METKRCAYCHKLQRADAQICSRCGHGFVQKKVRRSTREWTQPSIPPASPHRAGHYFGLHPEDQPFQSNKIAIQRPIVEEDEHWRVSAPEPDHIILPTTDPFLRRRLDIAEPYAERRAEALPISEEPAYYKPRRGLLSRRTIAILLALSCIFLLLASSILWNVWVKKARPTIMPKITALPSQLRTNDLLALQGSGFSTRSMIAFTYDKNGTLLDSNGRPLEVEASERGTFSIQLRIPGNWTAGQHFVHVTDEAAKVSVSTGIIIQQPPVLPAALQLSTSTIAFGTASSDKVISLSNNGGGQVSWQASSDQSWLQASPSNGVFSGHEDVHIMVSRGMLVPNVYTGHITFSSENSTGAPLTVAVTMKIEADQTVLTASPATLPFALTLGEGPVLKAIILQNDTNQPLHWNASTTTSTSSSWLSATPATGTLAANDEGFMNARVDAEGLQPGTYQGTLTLSTSTGGVQQEVIVTLTVA